MLLATKGVWEDNHIENNDKNDQNHDVEPVPHPYDSLLHHLLEITSYESGMYICVLMYVYIFIFLFLYTDVYVCIYLSVYKYIHKYIF
jgi:hypothetical protein